MIDARLASAVDVRSLAIAAIDRRLLRETGRGGLVGVCEEARNESELFESEAAAYGNPGRCSGPEVAVSEGRSVTAMVSRDF